MANGAPFHSTDDRDDDRDRELAALRAALAEERERVDALVAALHRRSDAVLARLGEVFATGKRNDERIEALVRSLAARLETDARR